MLVTIRRDRSKLERLILRFTWRRLPGEEPESVTAHWKLWVSWFIDSLKRRNEIKLSTIKKRKKNNRLAQKGKAPRVRKKTTPR